MNGTNTTIFKNAGFLMASQLTTWGLSMALVIILRRYLGPEASGQISLAISIWAIMGMLISFGMDMHITKEIARRPSQTPILVGTSMGIRTVFYFIGFGLVAAYAYGVSYSQQSVWVIYIIGFGNLVSQYASIYRSVLEGSERMGYIALSDIASKLITSVVGIILLLRGGGVLLIASAFAGVSFINLFIQCYYANRVQPIRLQFSHQTAHKMLRESFSYLSVLIFRTLYIQVDIIIISLFVNETVIGWYSAADGLFGTLLFVPTVFVTAAFPAMSRMSMDEPESLQKIIQKSFTMLLLLSIPIGLGIFAVANNLVVLLFGDAFANSGPVLAIMGIVLIFTYPNMLIGRFLIATNKQRIWSIVLAVATLVTIPLDLVFIPWCQEVYGNGAIGGALAFVVTESCMLIAGLTLLPKGILGRTNLWDALRVSFAGMIMVLVVWQLRSNFIGIPVLVGTVLYISLVLLMGIIPKEDLQTIQKLSKNVLLKFRRPQTQPS